MTLKPRHILISSLVVTLIIAAALLRRPSLETATDQVPSVKPPSLSNTQTSSTPAVFNGSKEAITAQVSSLRPHTDTATRLRLVEALSQLGPGAEPKLAASLTETPSLTGKGVLADALARIGTSDAVDALLAALASATSPEARREIVRAFDALPPGKPVETLASSLVTALDPQVRDGVIATVARAADASTVQFLAEMYHEPEAFTGQAEGVLAALGSIHNAGAVEPMKALLISNHEVPLMQAAVHSLGKIGTPDALQAIASALASVGTTNPALRQQMIATVQAVENPAAMPWLQKTAQSQSDQELAKAAAAAMVTIKKSPQ